MLFLIKALCPKVIVTSFLFPNGRFSLEHLKAISKIVGKDRLVVDVRLVVFHRMQESSEAICFQLSTESRPMACGDEQVAGHY